MVQTVIDDVRERIAWRAQQIAAERGYEAGRELDNWLTAESQLVWKPELRLEERTDGLVAKFRLPEVQPQDVQVYIEPQTLIILGQTITEATTEGVQIYGDEFRYGQIYREISLPVPIEPARAKARLSDGVLTVSLPKLKTEAQPKPEASARRKAAQPKEPKKVSQSRKATAGAS
jgi:HSP20 family protein